MEQECRCPHCDKLLGKTTMVDARVVIHQTWCKNCRKLVDVVVKRQEAGPTP